MKIPIFEICVNEGRRKVKPAAIQELVDSISKVGLLNPITVDQGYTLIAGLHRLEAAKQLGWTEIECSVSDLNGLLAELAEIDENYVRKDLSDDEFRELLLHRKEIYEGLHPEVRRGGDRSKRTKCPSASVKSFADDTADKWGVDPRTIRREIQTAKNLTTEAKTILRDSDTKLTKKDALNLSRLVPEQQKEAASQLAAGAIRSMSEYHPAPAEPEEAEGLVNLPDDQKPSAISPSAKEGYYATIKDSVDDLKNPNKDRSRTPDTFLASISFFLRRFCQNVSVYAEDEYEAVFPALTREHLDQIQQDIHFVCVTLDDLYTKIERNAKK